MKRVICTFFFILLTAQFSVVSAQNEPENPPTKGTERFVSRQKTDGGDCYVFKNYVVRTAGGEDVGEDIFVYKHTAETTAAVVKYCGTEEAPYLSVKNPDANYFIGLSGKYLFVDSGTSVESRGLEIYDLNSKKSVYSTEYRDEIEVQAGRYVTFAKPSAKPGAVKNCREAAKWKKQGLGVGWVQNAKLDLQTLKSTPVGALRCVAQQ